MKRRVITIVILLIFLLTIPLSLVCVGFALPSQYYNTYYAVLPKMFKKLKNTQGKKIIVIGNSAIAFGLDSKLVESEIEGYSVCSFGLYGAIGTKAMMDLSRVNIGEGDIVILAPEQASQPLSLYFSSEFLWNAADGDFSLLKYVKNRSEMAGGFLGYVGRKYNYFKNSAPDPTDVYASSSFDNNLKMIYERPYNVLPLGYDGMGRISFDTDVFSPAFAEYVNEFNRYVKKCGAELLFSFAPVNVLGIEAGTSEEDIDNYYDYIDGLLDCEILGSPQGYIFESDWFYDTNVHVNTAGSVVYSRQLVSDLKVHFSDSSPIKTQMPEKPQVPDDGVTGEDGKHSAYFTYEESGTGWNITGLTEEGKKATSIEIPDFYQGRKVLSFDTTVFAGNTAIEEIHLGRYIYAIEDGSFNGCENFKRLYVSPEVKNPDDCKAYFMLPDEEWVRSFKIYVPQAKVSDYQNSYFWARLAAYFVGY